MISGVGAEFVVASPDVLDERVASDDNGGGSVAFESAHWAKTCLQLTVIALDPIVRVRLGVVEGIGNLQLNCCLQRGVSRSTVPKWRIIVPLTRVIRSQSVRYSNHGRQHSGVGRTFLNGDSKAFRLPVEGWPGRPRGGA